MKRTFNAVKNHLGTFVVVGGTSLAITSNANAAIATEVTDAITAVGTDAATLGAAVLVVLVGIKGLKMLRRAM